MNHRFAALWSRVSLSVLSLAVIPLAAGACAQGSDPGPDSGGAPAAPGLNGPDLSLSAEARTQLLAARYQERAQKNPYGTLSGAVLDLDDKPVAGVVVRVGGQEAATDASGLYKISQVPIGSYAASFSHPSYVFQQRRSTVELGEDSWLTTQVMPRSHARHFDVDRAAHIEDGPLSLDFEPNDLVFERDGSAVHGEVDIVVTAIDPRQKGHLFAAPAELEGLTAAGEQRGLFSYGMLEVEIYQGTKRVQVRKGQTVEATMDLGRDSGLHVGDTIPMWHHDTNLGIWAQERGLDAQVQESHGVMVATTTLPHFSAWNYDVLADGMCAPMVLASTMQVSRIRTVSTDAAGALDTTNPWTVSFDCRAVSGRSSLCAINVPAGQGWARGDVTFKLQVQTTGSTTWCDLDLSLDGAAAALVFDRNKVNTFKTNHSITAGSWCGSQMPFSAFVSGDFNSTLAQYTIPTDRVVFGSAATSSCANVVGSNAVTTDPGFARLSANATSASFKNDVDRDGVLDTADKCIANTTTNQADANNDGIGDTCEALCYIAPGPEAVFYDADSDGIDDYCDNIWSVANPSQYTGP